MRSTVLVVLILAMASTALEANRTTTVSVAGLTWSEMVARGDFEANQFVTRHGVQKLKVSNTTDRELRFEVFGNFRPDVTESSYAIRGRVEYEGVEGHGYLEMLSYFPQPDTGPYFSRTLAQHGLTGWFTGTGTKCFEVPFFLRKGDPKPTKLAFYVVLPARGTVYLSPIAFVEGDLDSAREKNLTRATFGATRGQWWSDRASGLVGGILGSVIGALGGLMGTLVSRGKARVFVLAALKAEIFVGLASLMAGVVAVVARQSSAVYYPLFLCGVVLIFVSACVSPGVRRRYDELELRRISAQDAMG